MTSNLHIPSISKVTKMSGIKSLVGKKITKKSKFMGETVLINKLTLNEVERIQEQAKTAGDNDALGFELLKTVIRISAEDGADLTDEDFAQLPLDEVTTLSNDIMEFSGMGNKKGS
jgi:hypothetical protein